MFAALPQQPMCHLQRSVDRRSAMLCADASSEMGLARAHSAILMAFGLKLCVPASPSFRLMNSRGSNALSTEMKATQYTANPPFMQTTNQRLSDGRIH